MIRIVIIFVLVISTSVPSESRRIRKKIRIPPKPDRIPNINPAQTKLNTQQRTGKFFAPFSLFNVIKFSNSECITSSDTHGTCYTSSECANLGGTADGGCASGFGVCCSFSNTCDSTTQQNGTYFSSPTTIPSVCSLMITPLNDNICQVGCSVLSIRNQFHSIILQVRINFETLSLMDPNADGLCKSEYVQVGFSYS